MGLALLAVPPVISVLYGLYYQQLVGPLTEENVVRAASFGNGLVVVSRLIDLAGYSLIIAATLRLRRERAAAPARAEGSELPGRSPS